MAAIISPTRAAIIAAAAAGGIAFYAPRTPARASAALPVPRRSVALATGRIEGTVEISTQLSARRVPFRPYADPGSGIVPPQAARDPISAELHNVVIYLEGTDLPPRAAQGTARGRMAQHDERFVPHVLPIVQGATVDFPNEDNVFHNVFSLSSAAGKNGFDLGRYPKGDSRAVTFNAVGTIQVFCHIHSDMSAVVLVLPNAYFTTPGDDHRFVLDNIPEGDYTIVAWHERIKPAPRHIHVTAGQATSLDFNIPLPQGGGK